MQLALTEIKTIDVGSFICFALHHSGGKYILINSFALTMSLGAQLCTSELKQPLNKVAERFYWKQL